ncbi:hypothetical protein [Pseudonocardia acidicola]|uniref:Uncharacterized protein n=1 Tax=Pseudonocardia acidicola TaxID=2724939 RepID=A0ABX1SG36_9PSEU|nr:hypothetical protein [Pseudonocardia acidicola]NMH99757.1 hypothetical protein [Pseudonocardia acidicola]
MTDQVWPWVLVIVIVGLVAVVALLARRRSTATAPVGPDATAEVEARDVVTPGPATADPDAVTAGPVTTAVDEGTAVATDTAATRDAAPSRAVGTAAPAGPTPPEPATAEPARPEPGTEERPPAVDSALASLDAGLTGGVASAPRPRSAADVVSSVVAQARPGPHPGSALPNPDGYAPSTEFMIKANNGAKRYYDLGSPYYVRTRADLWFHSAEDAERAGFSSWNDR